MNQKELRDIFIKKYRWSGEAFDVAFRAGFRCEYCGRYFLDSVNDYDSWQTDHILPISKKGDNSFDNLASVCKTCNFKKRNWVPKDIDISNLNREEKIQVFKEYIEKKRSPIKRDIDQMKALFEEYLKSLLSRDAGYEENQT